MKISKSLIVSVLIVLITSFSGKGQSTVGTITTEEVGDDIHLASDGNLYTSHYGGTKIRRILLDGTVETVLDHGITTIGAIDVAENMTFYLTSYDEGWIGKFREGDTTISIIAENLSGPAGIEIGADNQLYVTTNASQSIMRMDTTGANVEIYYTGSPLFFPTGITSNPDGALFITNLLNGDISSIEDGQQGEVVYSFDVDIDNNTDMGYLDYDPVHNKLYVALYLYHTIMGIDLDTGNSFFVAGTGSDGFVDGTGASATFSFPTGVVVSEDGARLYVTDGGLTTRLRYIDLDLSVGITEESIPEISLFPNPTTGMLYIESKELQKFSKLEVFSVTGQKLWQESIQPGELKLNMSQSPPGMYSVVLTDQHGNKSVAKVVKVE